MPQQDHHSANAKSEIMLVPSHQPDDGRWKPWDITNAPCHLRDFCEPPSNNSQLATGHGSLSGSHDITCRYLLVVVYSNTNAHIKTHWYSKKIALPLSYLLDSKCHDAIRKKLCLQVIGLDKICAELRMTISRDECMTKSRLNYYLTLLGMSISSGFSVQKNMLVKSMQQITASPQYSQAVCVAIGLFFVVK